MTAAVQTSPPAVPLRPADEVMRLSRMGASFPTRLSFMRSLLRRMHGEGWRFEQRRFDLDAQGFGTVVLTAHTPEQAYSLVVFSHDLPPEKRTDRVIAEAWDATFSLYDGIPSDADIARLAANTPKQEAGRFTSRELVLGRANRSLRLFSHVTARLSAGQQPDIGTLSGVGYLMRTTAVYGSGKFGCGDRALIADRPELQGAFQVEMLAVWLFRWFTVMLIEHLARVRGGDSAVPLAPEVRDFLGVGNATGLGMAPFLGRHPQLVHAWVTARETALARVRSLAEGADETRAAFLRLLVRARQHVSEWQVDDPQQMARIEELHQDLARLSEAAPGLLDATTPWDRIWQFGQARLGVEAQELLLALLLEPHGALVDDLADRMHVSEHLALDPAMRLSELRRLIAAQQGWVDALALDGPEAEARFWYYSEEKLEPRLGHRHAEPGGMLEMPLAFARDIRRLVADLAQAEAVDDTIVAAFLLRHPQHRHTVRRVQSIAGLDYAEVRDNLVADGVRPIDLLRFKLAFFGASKFDPKSDLWTRITLFQGAPQPDGLADADPDGWAFAIRPVQVN
ncbi:MULTISPECIES: hypothetical protein [unclassified Minwuia]|jgi:hypothetical protein|uniref:hypothetical protein n=1 Tax=unclassified Minwuia TaxID=2618799 RepID=UPI00247A0D95|nr:MULTISPECIES: hypothetical protein [unclassified Minwuia]